MAKLLTLFVLLLASLTSSTFAYYDNSPRLYQFFNEPIDVVIPTTSKDEMTLEYCINGIRENCQNIRRIIIVSPYRMTDKAEWFNERDYPFSKADVAFHLNNQNNEDALSYQKGNRLGWYYQQLLKLYAPFIIPGISSNVLIVDADVVFFRPVDFINEEGGGNYALSSEYHTPYFTHAERLLPGLKKIMPWSGIVHHMIFQKPVLDDLFTQVEAYNQTDFWKAFCSCVKPSELYSSGASEYEIYFHFVFSKTKQVKLRQLLWKNSDDLSNLQNDKRECFDFVTYHAWMRK
jgi:hypothetical protein